MQNRTATPATSERDLPRTERGHLALKLLSQLKLATALGMSTNEQDELRQVIAEHFTMMSPDERSRVVRLGGAIDFS